MIIEEEEEKKLTHLRTPLVDEGAAEEDEEDALIAACWPRAKEEARIERELRGLERERCREKERERRREKEREEREGEE